VKYPRTYHLPKSPNLQNDDRKHTNVDFFEGQYVVATIKRDGENTSMYSDYIHARSLDSKHHPSRDWVKALHGRIKHDIPDGWRICGENLYAKHSILYKNLPGTFFEVFSMWDKNNVCISWQDTELYCEILGLTPVPTFYRGGWNPDLIQKAFEIYVNRSEDEVEGYVVRIEKAFPYKDFRRCTAKYVRKNHVQTSEFWMTQPVVPNKLKEAQ